MCPEIKAAVAPLGDLARVNWMRVAHKSNSGRIGSIMMCAGFEGLHKDEDVLCLPWLMWGCKRPDCKKAHAHCNELPGGHGAKVGAYMEEAVRKFKDGG